MLCISQAFNCTAEHQQTSNWHLNVSKLEKNRLLIFKADTRYQHTMALLSSGKCSSGEGSSPPSLRGVGNTGGSGGSGGGANAGTRSTLIPPGLYCPMLPPWHLALLTHHALHAKGELGSPGLAVGCQAASCSVHRALLCLLSRWRSSFPFVTMDFLSFPAYQCMCVTCFLIFHIRNV